MNKNKSNNKKNLNVRKVSFFYQLFIYISLVVILIIIASSTIGNRLHTTQINNTIKQSNEKMLSLTSYNFDFMYQTVESFVLRLSSDVKVNQLLYTEKTPETALTIHRLMEVMTSYKTNVEFIQSYYIYNGENTNFFTIGSNNTIRTADNMFDQEIVEIIANIRPTDPRVIVLPRIISESPYGTGINKEVYTYIFSIFDRDKVYVEKVFVVNVKADWFVDSILAMEDQNLANDSVLAVVKYDGIVMAHSDPVLFGEDISKEDYFIKVMMEEASEGTLNMPMHGKDYIVSYNRLESEGISLISISEKDQLYSSIKLLNVITLSVMFGLLFLGIIMSYILSKFFYKPISNLNNNLQILFKHKTSENDSQNEFQHMQLLFEDVHHDLQDLQFFKNDNMGTLKEQMFYHILSKKIAKMDEVEKQCKELDFGVDVKSNMQILYIAIDKYAQIESTPELILTIDLIKKKVYEILGETFEVEILQRKYYFVVLINVKAGQALSINDNDSQHLLRQLQQSVVTATSYSITISISSVIRSLDDLHDTYSMVRDLSKTRLTLGHESIIYKESTEAIDGTDFELPIEDTKKMLSYLKVQDALQCKKSCKNILIDLEKYEVKNVLLAISFMTLSFIDTINLIKNNARLEYDLDFTQWNAEVIHLETLDEVYACYCETIDSVILQVKDHKKNRSSDLIEAIHQYIDQNYDSYSMTANSVAKSLGLSLKYANTLFKKETGVSIALHINDFRLDKAAELLRSSQKSVEYILDDIGWENQSYFFTLFKKRFGVTPTIYRMNQ